MQQNVPESYLPDAAVAPEPIHALPETDYPAHINVAEELVAKHVEAGRGDNVAIRFQDEEVTYRDLQGKVNRFGNALRNLGVEPPPLTAAPPSLRHDVILVAVSYTVPFEP